MLSVGQARLDLPEHSPLEYTYHPKVFEELGRFGLRPKPTTQPTLAKAYVNDLYRHELRRLRARLVAREIPKEGYSDRVVEVRKRYGLLSVRVEFWTRVKSDA